MAASDVEISEELIKDLPASITRGQLKQAWKARELIWRLMAEGKNAYQISPNVHVPVRVIEFLNQHRPGGPPASESAQAEQPAPESPAGPEAGPQPAAEAPEVPPVPPGALGFPSSPPSAPLPTRQPQGEAPRPQWMGGPDLGQIGEPVQGPGWGAKFEVPDVYRALYNLCVAYGIQAVQAEGIVWQFQALYEPDDLAALRKLLTAAGKNTVVTNQIVGGWEAVMKRMGSEDTTGPGEGTDTDTRLRAIRRRLGLEDTKTAMDPDLRAIEDLEKEERALRIEKTRLEMEETRNRIRQQTGGAPSAGAGERIPLILDFGGGPVQMQVEPRMLPYYDKYIARPGHTGPATEGANEPPVWFKPYAEQFAADRREREEDARDRRTAEIVKSAVDPLTEKMRLLTENAPRDTRLEEEMRRLREQVAAKDREAADLRFQHLEDLVRSGMSVEAAQVRIEQERARARAVGMVPQSSVGELREEQIRLASMRDSETNRNNAQARAVDIVAKKVEASPVMSMAREARLPQLAGEFARTKLSGLPENQGALEEQSQQHMEAAAAELERGLGEQPSPAAPGETQTGMPKGIVSR